MCLQTLQTPLAGVWSGHNDHPCTSPVLSKSKEDQESWIMRFKITSVNLFLWQRNLPEDLKFWHFILPLLNVCAVSGIKVFVCSHRNLFWERWSSRVTPLNCNWMHLKMNTVLFLILQMAGIHFLIHIRSWNMASGSCSFHLKMANLLYPMDQS